MHIILLDQLSSHGIVTSISGLSMKFSGCMLQRMGQADYHTYHSSYFDWHREIQEGSGVRFEDILVENRFGFTNFSTGFLLVSGQLVEGWESVCARMLGQVCDLNIPTGPIVVYNVALY